MRKIDWLTALWPITWDPEFYQIWWWNINNNVSFHFRLFPRKTNMTKFFKKSKKTYFGAILSPFCSNFGKNEFSWKKGLCQFLNISIIIVPLCQKSEKTNEPFLRKMLNCWTDRQTDNSDFIGPSLGWGSNY